MKNGEEMPSVGWSIKWKGPSARSIKCCPRCGSSNIRLSSSFDAWLTPEQYVCANCGYKGPIVLERETSEGASKPD